MLTPEKSGMLRTFLGALPENVALRLAKAIEVDRLAGGEALPHALILEALRPALRHSHSIDRTPTPLRIFCQPFADLLQSAPRKEKRKGRIARDSVVPVWDWLSNTLMPEAVRDYAVAMRKATATRDRDTIKAAAVPFWSLAATEMHKALAFDRKAVRTAIGSDAAADDAQEMALLLAAGEEMTELQDTLPRGTPLLTEDLTWKLRGIYDRVVQRVPDAAAYIAVAAMNRLEKPWEALKLPLQVSRQTSDTLISNTDMGLAGEVLLGDLEIHSNAIRPTRHPIFDPVELSKHVYEFARLSTGLVQEVELRRDGPWHQRLMKDRNAVADTMETLMERAPKEIVAGFPVHKTGSYGGGPKSPDISKAPDADKTDRCLRYAKLVVGCRSSAAGASFGAAQKDAYTEACAFLKSYSDDIVRELRTAEGPKRQNAEQYFNIAADLTAILFSAQEAEVYRRRGRAALGDSSPAAA
ncbi:MAG TPA: hypothetical protein VHL34_00095 [Rhizomicrobium sp.]|jgi:hypothetical protein|nr:hypothetical protein [Rhizomicrobium sp.]